MMFIASLVFAWSILLPLAWQAAPPSKDADIPVTVQSISVEGSRLPAKSVIGLTGLKAGQTIDEKAVRAALAKANLSGLFSGISYNYESEPGDTKVTLVLVVKDQLPLVPASINVPNVDEEEAWQWLQRLDPLFTRDMPPVEAAIRLYSRYIQKFLETKGRTDIIIAVPEEGKEAATGQVVALEFKPGALHQAPSRK